MDRLKAMESFAAIAKHESYSKAAKELGVSRALMSKRVTWLEARLGMRLLSRNTHRLSLTDAGQEFFTHCQTILSEIESAEQSLIEQRTVARGSLKILASKTFGVIHMGQVVAEFMKANPRIQVSLIIRDMAQQSLDLVGEGFDLAIRTMAMNDSSLIARKIVSLPWLAVAAPDYLKQYGQPKTPQELTQHNCLYPGGDPEYRWSFEGPHGTEIVKVSGFPRSNLTTVLRDAAVAGIGIGLLPQYCIDRDLAAEKLVPILKGYQTEERALFAIFQRDRYLPLRVRLFIEFLSERFKEFCG